ncbi:MAG: hypothetical protein KDE20_24575, partial [Caldilineaceae bacterium]|nr:hypothetical protein [Caldilineaceae bacterium]
MGILIWAGGPAGAADAADTNWDLQIHPEDAALVHTAGYTSPAQDKATADDETMSMGVADDENWDLAGPYEMRSADPEEYGVLEVKNIFGWSTTRGESDEFEYEFEVEWGCAENHELIFEVPVELGDGRVDGNGDAEFGWHWRLWKEQDWLPAFAMRNFVRVPTGIESSGVDYEWIGLITKSIIPGALRFDANPYIKSVNGDNEEDARHFLWGARVGLDWQVHPGLVLVALYRYEAGELEGTRDNHSLQVGGEWEFAEHQELGFSGLVGLDGDANGP